MYIYIHTPVSEEEMLLEAYNKNSLRKYDWEDKGAVKFLSFILSLLYCMILKYIIILMILL